MTNFTRSLYSTTAGSALVLAALTMAAPALAQTPAAAGPVATAAPDDDAIVVTGIRASLAASEKIKKNNAVIVEAISAEDIGKLPDVSIADSLARLPGVTAQRLEGRDQRLSIRGLGPDFGVTLLNGREQVTVGDNRGVEYDQYPSEFFRNVIVYKSANATVLPSGVSGTVDLRMLRPLSEKRAIAVQLRGQMNSQHKLNPEGKRFGYRASGTFVDRFADDTIGIAIGVSKTSSPTQNERYNAWGFPGGSDDRLKVPVTNPNGCIVLQPDGSCALILGGAKPYVQSSLLDRTGVVGTLEFRPSDRWHTTIDALYSKFKETQYLRGIEFPINPGWGANTTVSNTTVQNGLITAATVSNVVAVVRNDYNKRTADNLSIGINNEFAITEKVKLTVDGSWSRAKRTDFLLENYSGTGYNQTGAKDVIRITANPNGTFDIVPTLDYGNAGNLVLTDPRGWGYNGTQTVVQSGFLNQPRFKDDLKALRASLGGELGGGFKSWEVGANYSRRSKDASYTSYFLCPKDANPSCTLTSGQITSAPIPAAAIVGTVPLAYLGVPRMIALNPNYLYANAYNAEFDNRPDSLARDYNVTEKVLTGYAQVNIDADLGSVPVAGALGVQVVHTKQSSTGRIATLQTFNNVPTVVLAPAKGSSSYTDILPSLALSFNIAHNTFLKTGVSKTMIRPRLDQERVTQNVGIDFSRLTGTTAANSAFSSSGGNPALQPYRSFNVDGSLEHYFAKSGYIALSGYYKKLTKFVDPNNSTTYDFASLAANLPASIRSQLGTTLGRLSLPANTGRGYILGQEATLSLPFSNFSSALDGLGIFTSISHVKSRVRYANSPSAITIPGQSKWVGTAEAYFEKSGFQARVSYRYRSKFLAEIAGLSANPEYRTSKAEGILDAQIGYEFQKGTMLQGLSVLLQAKNLTDRPFVTYDGNDPRLVRDYQHYGRDYYLGLAYKF